MRKLFAACLVLVLLLAGCGGGAASSGSTEAAGSSEKEPAESSSAAAPIQRSEEEQEQIKEMIKFFDDRMNEDGPIQQSFYYPEDDEIIIAMPVSEDIGGTKEAFEKGTITDSERDAWEEYVGTAKELASSMTETYQSKFDGIKVTVMLSTDFSSSDNTLLMFENGEETYNVSYFAP